MASLTRDKQGYRLRFSVRGTRAAVRLGAAGLDAAERALHHVEVALRAHRLSQPIPVRTVDWLHRSAPPGVLSTLAELRVLDDRRMLHDAWHAWVESKLPVVSTRRIELLERVGERLLSEIGDVEVEALTESSLLAWRDSMVAQGAAPNTVAAHSAIVQQFFKWAIAERLCMQSTAGQLPTHFVASDRLEEVSTELIVRLCQAADERDPELGLALRLARWGGLRAAEILRVALADINTTSRALKIRDTKREHHGHGSRTIPIFPELAPVLTVARRREEQRGIAGRRGLLLPVLGGLSPSAMSQRAVRLAAALEVTLPARLWQNCRATRESELMDTEGIVRACKWIGNSPAVAMEHYAIVRSVDFEQATKSKNEKGAA